MASNLFDDYPYQQACSTVFRTGSLDVGSSGTNLKKLKPRKGPFKSKRRPKQIEDGQLLEVTVKKVGVNDGLIGKRKTNLEMVPSSERRAKPKVVPKEGLSKC